VNKPVYSRGERVRRSEKAKVDRIVIGVDKASKWKHGRGEG
jgi:hypothetical protein